MAIYKYLDVSTAHVTKKDMSVLAGEVGCFPAFLTVATYDEGCFVSVPDDVSEEGMWELSIAFFNVLSYARKLGCQVVRFDRDADQIDGLAIFDW